MSQTTNSTATPTDKWKVATLLEFADAAGVTYEPPHLVGATDAAINADGRRIVNFASCSLLGMHVRSDITERFAQHGRDHGLAVGGSRMIQGSPQPLIELEKALSRTTGKEKSLIFASGMLANVGFVHALTEANTIATNLLGLDMPKPVFVLDKDAHWSIRKAVEALPRNERVFMFEHNDPQSLRETLAKIGDQPAVVMFESVYSADGSIAPVGDIVDIAEEFGALTFIDDANGYFIYGQPDHPFHAEFEAIRRCTFHMVSFSKAIGLEGGGIAGPADFMEVFKYLAGTNAFTASMLPAAAGAAVDIIELLEKDPTIIDSYLARAQEFRERLLAIGCTLDPTPSYICAVHIGDDSVAEKVRQSFEEHGYLVPVFRYPAVRVGEAGLRLMFNARHSNSDTEGFLTLLEQLKNEHGF